MTPEVDTPVQLQHTPQLLDSYLKALRLPAMLRESATVARHAAEHGATYELFLQQLTELEVQQRQAASIARRLKLAGFPVVKELSEFDFAAAPRLNKKRLLDPAQCRFVDPRSNLVLNGAPGTGKTHLAIALGRAACRRGYKVRFHTASRLANLYQEARDQRQLLRLERQIQTCDLIVVDELGYLPLDRHGAEHLFGFFSQCYETTSLILTTNLPFAEWPAVFANDERMTGALLDRLTHHVQIVTIEGDSYRLRSSTKRKKGDELQAGIEHDAGFSFAPITPPRPHTYPAVTKAFATPGSHAPAADPLALLTAAPRPDPALAPTLRLSPPRAGTG